MSKISTPTNRAVVAMKSLLTQVSAITLKDICLESSDADGELEREFDLLVHVEVFGRPHTLACWISSRSDPQNAREMLAELCGRIGDLPGRVTPVLILPVLSHEVQSLCDEYHAGCVDLRGNGRLAVDEVFISMRSLPRRVLQQPAPAVESRIIAVEKPGTASSAGVLPRGFPPAAHAVMPPRLAQSVRAVRAH